MEPIKISECVTKRIPGKKSSVWRFFCQVFLKDKLIDPDNYYCEVCFKAKIASDQTLDSVRRYRISTASSNLIHHLTIEHNIVITCGTSIDKYLTFGAKRPRLGYKATKKKLTDDLAKWFCRDLLPFEKVDSPGMQDFFREYNIFNSIDEWPNSRSVAVSGVYRVYNQLKEKVIQNLEGIENFGIAADMWTDSCRRMKYIGFTLHFIKETELMNINLGTIAFPESHTSTNIYHKISDICQDFGLNINKAFIVRDCGANIVAACRDYDLPAHSCIGHGIHNLITVDGVKHVVKIVSLFDKMREVHSSLRFKNCNLTEKTHEINAQSLCAESQNPTDEISIEISENNDEDSQTPVDFTADFIDVAEEVIIEEERVLVNDSNKTTNDPSASRTQPTTLKSYCPTRWHSLLLMARSMVHNSTAINGLLSEGEKYELIFTKSDIFIMQELIDFLESFKETVDLLTSDKSPTINKALVLRCELESKLQISETDIAEIKELKDAMAKKFAKRYPLSELLVIASILDPKFKNLDIIDTFCEDNFTSRENLIKKYYRKLIGPIDSSGVTENENPGLFTQLARKFSTKPQQPTDFDLEIASYFSSKDERDVLVFWSDRKAAWPLLYKLSTAILAIPATSVPVERLFSIAGLTLTKKRCQLKPEKVNKILFIHDNYSLLKNSA